LGLCLGGLWRWHAGRWTFYGEVSQVTKGREVMLTFDDWLEVLDNVKNQRVGKTKNLRIAADILDPEVTGQPTTINPPHAHVDTRAQLIQLVEVNQASGPPSGSAAPVVKHRSARKTRIVNSPQLTPPTRDTGRSTNLPTYMGPDQHDMYIEGPYEDGELYEGPLEEGVMRRPAQRPAQDRPLLRRTESLPLPGPHREDPRPTEEEQNDDTDSDGPTPRPTRSRARPREICPNCGRMVDLSDHRCWAKETGATCHRCNTKGHLQLVCRTGARKNQVITESSFQPSLRTMERSIQSMRRSVQRTDPRELDAHPELIMLRDQRNMDAEALVRSNQQQMAALHHV